MKLWERWRMIRRGWKETGMDERMETLPADEWEQLEREGRVPGPRDDPPEEPSHPAARLADRGRGRERADKLPEP